MPCLATESTVSHLCQRVGRVMRRPGAMPFSAAQIPYARLKREMWPLVLTED